MYWKLFCRSTQHGVCIFSVCYRMPGSYICSLQELVVIEAIRSLCRTQVIVFCNCFVVVVPSMVFVFSLYVTECQGAIFVAYRTWLLSRPSDPCVVAACYKIHQHARDPFGRDPWTKSNFCLQPLIMCNL